MGFQYWYIIMILATTTFLLILYDARGTLDKETRHGAIILGIIWPITLIVLLLMLIDKDE